MVLAISVLPSDALDTGCENGMGLPVRKCFARGKLFFTFEVLVLLLRRRASSLSSWWLRTTIIHSLWLSTYSETCQVFLTSLGNQYKMMGVLRRLGMAVSENTKLEFTWIVDKRWCLGWRERGEKEGGEWGWGLLQAAKAWSPGTGVGWGKSNSVFIGVGGGIADCCLWVKGLDNTQLMWH